MEFDRIGAYLISATVAFSALPAHASNLFDGNWNVTVTTSAGSCDPISRHPLIIVDGRVTGANGVVSGKVDQKGLVRVSIGSAFANGQLNDRTGSGKWNAASGGVPCSGRWVATLVSR